MLKQGDEKFKVLIQLQGKLEVSLGLCEIKKKKKKNPMQSTQGAGLGAGALGRKKQ